MFLQGKRIFLALLIVAAAGAVGCALPPSRVEFIERMAKDNRAIARSTRDFRDAVIPLKDGKPADAAKARTAYKTMETTLKDVRADADAMMLPINSSSARDFLAAYKAYLDGQQEILTTLMKQILDEVELPADGPPPAARWAIIDDIMKNKIPAKENETWAGLKTAQAAYASEHNYQVEGLTEYIDSLKGK